MTSAQIGEFLDAKRISLAKGPSETGTDGIVAKDVRPLSKSSKRKYQNEIAPVRIDHSYNQNEARSEALNECYNQIAMVVAEKGVRHFLFY